jgi:hypothetical protein
MSLFVRFMAPIMDSIATKGPRLARPLSSNSGNSNVGSNIPSDMHGKSEFNMQAYIRKMEAEQMKAQRAGADEIKRYQDDNLYSHSHAWRDVVARSMKANGHNGNTEELIKAYDNLPSTHRVYGSEPK